MKGGSPLDYKAGFENRIIVNQSSTYALSPWQSGCLIVSNRYGNVQAISLPDVSGPDGDRAGMSFMFHAPGNAPIQLSSGSVDIFPGSGAQMLTDWGRAVPGQPRTVRLTPGLWYINMWNGTWRLMKLDVGSDGLEFEDYYGRWDRMAVLAQSNANTGMLYFTFAGDSNATSFTMPGTRDSYFADVLISGHLIGDSANPENLKGFKAWSGQIAFFNARVMGGTLTEVHSHGANAAMLAQPSLVLSGSTAIQIVLTVGSQVDARYVARLSGVHNQGTVIGT